MIYEMEKGAVICMKKGAVILRKRSSYMYDINMAHCNSARDHRYVPTHTKEAWEQENNRLRTCSLT